MTTYLDDGETVDVVALLRHIAARVRDRDARLAAPLSQYVETLPAGYLLRLDRGVGAVDRRDDARRNAALRKIAVDLHPGKAWLFVGRQIAKAAREYARNAWPADRKCGAATPKLTNALRELLFEAFRANGDRIFPGERQICRIIKPLFDNDIR